MTSPQTLFSRIRAQLARLTISDGLSLLLLGSAVPFLAVFHRSRVIEDFWYHLALGHWIARTGSLFLFDPVSFQPFSRPQVYPLGVHTLVAAGEWIMQDPIRASILVRILLYVGTLAATWFTARTFISPIAGYLALVVVASDEATFFAGWSLMPAALVGIAAVLLVHALARKNGTAAGMLLLVGFTAHLVLPWLLVLGLILAAWTVPALRETVRRALMIGVLPALPFVGFVLANGSHFWVEKAIGYNPIPGYGPFGYASHYHLVSLAVGIVAFGTFHLLLPRSRAAANLLATSAFLAPFLIGTEHVFSVLGSFFRAIGMLLPALAPAMGVVTAWCAQADAALHPMALLNIGSVLALTAIVAFVALSLRALAPRITAAWAVVTGAIGALLTVFGGTITFHVEVEAARAWDGILLGCIVLAVAALVALLLPLVSQWRIGTPYAALIGAGLSATAGGVAAAVLPLERGATLWIPVALTVLLLVGITALLAKLLSLPRALRERPKAPLRIALALLLGLLPMLPTYGGRYFWHVLPLLLLVSLTALTPTKRLSVITSRIHPVVRVIGLSYLALFLVLQWPLFAYSRNYRREFLPQDTPFLMAIGAKGPTEYEEQGFRDLVRWVEEHAPADAIIHTDDPRTAHMLTVFTNRVADNGMFWESQTRELQDAVAEERKKGIGVFVYTGALPESLKETEVVGKWKVGVGDGQGPEAEGPAK